MPGPFPRPAAPGTVPAARLDVVAELQAACRGWAEGTPVHLPFTDLTFAFGFATLGDPDRARRLLADARSVMQHPIPAPPGGHKDYNAAVAAVVPGLAYRAFA